MRVSRVSLFVNGAEHSFDAGDTKASVIEKLGEPFDTGGTSRKRKSPSVFVYDPVERVEFHFDDDRLALIYREEDNGNEITPALTIRFN